MSPRKRPIKPIERVLTFAFFAALLALVVSMIHIVPAGRAKARATSVFIEDLSLALNQFDEDMGGCAVKVGSLQIPAGMLKTDEDRINLIRILTGKRMRADGSFDIIAEVQGDERWNGPYLKPGPDRLTPKEGRPVGQFVDAWQNPLMIRIRRGQDDPTMQHHHYSFEIYSWGPNQRDDGGSGDDITMWD